MSNVNETIVRYFAAWNESDPERRRDLVAKTWTQDGSYIDAHRQAVGHDAIDAMLARTQDQFPGYRVRLVSGIERHNNLVRFSWAAGGTPEAPLYLGGTDFVTLADDSRFKTVSGFIDAAPATMK
jgi:SnoaL-like domain